MKCLYHQMKVLEHRSVVLLFLLEDFHRVRIVPARRDSHACDGTGGDFYQAVKTNTEITMSRL